MQHQTDASRGAFLHEVLFYAGERDFVEQTGRFVTEGLAAGDDVLVVVPTRKIEALEDALGADARRVTFADMADVGHNPARIIPRWRAFVDEHTADGRGVRGIGEPISSDRTAARLVECRRHEALLNVAFADDPPLWLVCPYDTDELTPSILDDARRNHPLLATEDGYEVNPDYRGVDLAPSGEPLPEPSTPAAEYRFEADDLTSIRHFVTRVVRNVGVGATRVADLVAAANEIVTNSVRHGGGRGRVRVWSEREAVVCEVSDHGRLLDPLADRRSPLPASIGGRGLWLANGLCDLVQLRSGESGTVVRLHVFRDGHRPSI